MRGLSLDGNFIGLDRDGVACLIYPNNDFRGSDGSIVGDNMALSVEVTMADAYYHINHTISTVKET
jgi:hypothetical protein